jgi:PAS domain S-box-containing protein
LAKKTIVVPDQFGMWVLVLRQAGFEVHEAASGEEALRPRERKPDLALLDVDLEGGMDGLEVCRRLKTDPATAFLPVMLISALYVRTEDRVRALEGGADGYLTKPIDPADLVAHLKALLRVRQANESRFGSLLEKSFDAVILLAAEGTLLFATPSYPLILGYTPGEWVGRDVFDLVHPEELASVRERFGRLLRNPGGSETLVHRGRHKDGSSRWLEVRGTNLLDEPSVRAVVVNVRDITLRKQTEEALARDALLLANVRDSVIVTDLGGVVTYWNEGATRLFGWAAQEMLGRPLTDRLPEEARAEARDWIGRIRRGVEFEGDRQDYRKDGSRVWIHARTSLIKDSGGRPVAIMGLSHDINERRGLEEQLRQSLKMEAIGQLAGGVAHDFNNLLCIINGYSDILFNTLASEDPLRNLVDEIRKAGERSASLTRQLLTFSRKQVIAPRALDLNTVILDLEKILRRVIGEDVELATRLVPGLGNVEADPGQVEQVLLNLVVNARDAMPRGGELTIETKNVSLDESYAREHAEVRPVPYVLLAVSDTGCGMTPEVKAHVFEPFFTTKGQGKGTGLGLAVVHGIISQSGGHIEVDSEPGGGTSFKIYLPRVEHPIPAGKPRKEVRGPPRGSETVLLVEDEEAVRVVNRHTLRRGGYAVLEAGDGNEALRVAARHSGPIHLLVTDVVMPGLGGRQLAEQLLALRPEMKVLYVSGYPDDAVVRHGIREGEVHFLQKPFAPSALAQKVRDVLDAPHPKE